MTFGEKLYKLRKEKGFSQEALAEKLNTTRQAVSKWENGQGYPETEKLLMLSSIFKVTVDSLLKEELPREIGNEEPGYYVSRECASEYLVQQKKIGKRIALGMSLLIGAGMPYIAMGTNGYFSNFITAAVLIVSIAVLVTALFLDNSYQHLSKELLLFDPSVFGQLKENYEVKKKKLCILVVFGAVLIVANCFALKYFSILFPVKELCCLLLAAALYCILYSLAILDSYETLLTSQERMNRFHVRLLKKIKNKMVK